MLLHEKFEDSPSQQMIYVLDEQRWGIGRTFSGFSNASVIVGVWVKFGVQYLIHNTTINF